MKVKEFKLLLAFGLLSMTTTGQINNQTKSKMFCSAIQNYSTAPNYVVVTIKNLRTGEIKEICTEAPFLLGAVGQQTGTWNLDCDKNKDRYFELSKDSALWNIDFDLYSKSELNNFEKTLNVAAIVKRVKNGKLTGKTFSGNRKEQIMFAHIMFNNGVMITRGCIAGNICGLSYFIENK